jgi:hypothetical protein
MPHRVPAIPPVNDVLMQRTAGSEPRLLFAVIHETADAVEAAEDRERALAAMRWILRRVLEPKIR